MKGEEKRGRVGTTPTHHPYAVGDEVDEKVAAPPVLPADPTADGKVVALEDALAIAAEALPKTLETALGEIASAAALLAAGPRHPSCSRAAADGGR